MQIIFEANITFFEQNYVYCPDLIFQVLIMDSLHTNLDLFMLLRQEVKDLSNSRGLFETLKKKVAGELTEENGAQLLTYCQKFCSNIKGKWLAANRTFANFIKLNEDWLDSAITLPISKSFTVGEEDVLEIEETKNLPPEMPSPSCSFTPRKPFEELCPQQKRRRIEVLNKSLSPDELCGATIKNLKQSGQTDLAQIVAHLLRHPEHIPEVQACIERSKRDMELSPEKALSLMVNLKLSRWQYLTLRETIHKEVFLLPSYNRVLDAKQECYPSKDMILLCDEGAEVKLQALLDKTVSRLVTGYDLDFEAGSNLKLISKWGFDGASSQSNYKQVGHEDDSSVFMASLVPLKLLHNDSVAWENERPSSTAYCRPILFKFVKENKDTISAIKEHIDEQIAALHPSQFRDVFVDHQLLLTMIDGKISSHLSETSAAVCDICKAKPSEMNNLDIIKQKAPNQDIYNYGLSSLHAWIRCMECLLHIGMYPI